MKKMNTLLCFVILVFGGCTKTVRESVSREEIGPFNFETKVLSVILIDGTIITFNSEGGHFVPRGDRMESSFVILGKSFDEKTIEVSPDSTIDISLERVESDVPSTVLLVILGAAAAAGAVILALILAWAGSH